MKRRVTLLLMAMAAVLLIASGAALAAVSAKEKTAQGGEAQGKNARGSPAAKAKKDLQPNTVNCPNQPDNETCIGTSGNDHLQGGEEFDSIEGGKGDDTYDGKDGGDDLFDASKKSNDLYIIPATEFSLPAGHGGINITDRGGKSDVLDLSAYRSTDFTFSKFAPTKNDNLLELQGPGNRSIGITSFFTKNTIDSFKFSDVTLTAKQVKQKAV